MLFLIGKVGLTGKCLTGKCLTGKIVLRENVLHGGGRNHGFYLSVLEQRWSSYMHSPLSSDCSDQGDEKHDLFSCVEIRNE